MNNDFQITKESTKVEELRDIISKINLACSQGETVEHLADLFRQIPVPICVDWNNVIANNESLLRLNPGAVKLLAELKKLGTVIIVTTASDYEVLVDFFKVHNIFSEDMIFLAKPNYKPLATYFQIDSEGDYEKIRQLRLEFLQTHPGFQESDLYGSSFEKKLGPLFNKPWDVPIIDDARKATMGNPGMFGVHVMPWTEQGYDQMEKRLSDGELTLELALEKVKTHLRSQGVAE